MHGDAVRAHLAARNSAQQLEDDETRPYAGRTAARASLYGNDAGKGIDAWLRQVRDEKDPPSPELFIP